MVLIINIISLFSLLKGINFSFEILKTLYFNFLKKPNNLKYFKIKKNEQHYVQGQTEAMSILSGKDKRKEMLRRTQNEQGRQLDNAFDHKSRSQNHHLHGLQNGNFPSFFFAPSSWVFMVTHLYTYDIYIYKPLFSEILLPFPVNKHCCGSSTRLFLNPFHLPPYTLKPPLSNLFIYTYKNHRQTIQNQPAKSLCYFCDSIMYPSQYIYL